MTTPTTTYRIGAASSIAGHRYAVALQALRAAEAAWDADDSVASEVALDAAIAALEVAEGEVSL